MSEQHNYRIRNSGGWAYYPTLEAFESELKMLTIAPLAEFYQPGIGWVRYNPQPVDYVAIVKQCFDEIAAMRGQPQGTEARVCDDITERQAMGIAKYGTTVEKNNATLREWLQHAYEEALDMAVYLKRAIEKMDGK